MNRKSGVGIIIGAYIHSILFSIQTVNGEIDGLD